MKYASLATLHHQEILNHPERISSLKPLANQYSWEKINFPAGQKYWEKFKRNDPDVAFNILFVHDHDLEYVKDLEIKQAYISKYGETSYCLADTN